MGRHIGVEDTARGVFPHHKHIEQTKRGGDHHSEVACHDRLGMVADKRPPGAERFGIYLRTVRGDTRRPSFSNSSLAMRS